MRLALCVLVAACYAPHAPEGVPCTDDAHCPLGQRCVAGSCGGTLTGAPDAPLDALLGPDAPSARDTDGDGVLDADDNCPNVANADQGNEDGDALGDACDPCPIDANNADADGDGVGDACDPNPTKLGDRIVLFEGFHAGVPPGWTAGSGASAMGDDAVLAGMPAGHTALGPPGPVPVDATLTAAIVVDSVMPTASGDADVGLGLPYGPSDDGGILCWLYQLPSSGARELRLNDHSVGKALGSAPLAWQTGVPYVVSLTRQGTSYSCTGAALGTAPNGRIGSTSTALPASPIPAVRAYAVTANVRWLMLVQSP